MQAMEIDMESPPVTPATEQQAMLNFGQPSPLHLTVSQNSPFASSRPTTPAAPFSQGAPSPMNHAFPSPMHHTTSSTGAPSPMHHSAPSPAANATPSHGGMQMRQRATQKAPKQEEEPDQFRRFVRTFKTLDVYTKTEESENITTRTGSGGLISIISVCVILFLTLNEIYRFLVPEQHTSIVVDTRPAEPLQINFDITFHALRCSETAIDVMDVSGDMQVAIEANVHRHRLAPDGSTIGKVEYEDHAHDNEAARGAQQLNPMLMAMGLGGFVPNGGPDLHADKRGEGCRVTGKLEVNKVAGNVHIALGGVHSHGKPKESEEHATGVHAGPHNAVGGHHHAGHPQQQHVHQFMIQEMASYNCSHTIHQLSFGELYPGVVNPLDGASQIIPQGAGSAHFQYFVKIVPTVYESSFSTVDTNQFSVTQHTQYIVSRKNQTGNRSELAFRC
jgi:hypothetical protein